MQEDGFLLSSHAYKKNSEIKQALVFNYKSVSRIYVWGTTHIEIEF